MTTIESFRNEVEILAQELLMELDNGQPNIEDLRDLATTLYDLADEAS